MYPYEGQPPYPYHHVTVNPFAALANENQVVTLDAIQADGALQNAGQVLAGPVAGLSALPFSQGYHRYHELATEFVNATINYPDLFSPLISIGSSYEGRPMWVARMTANAQAVHPDRPAVLFTGGQHGKEHLGVEMCLHIMLMLIAGHTTPGSELFGLLQKVVVFIAPNVNPDGSEWDFDHTPGTWRKNRQALEGTTDIGIDLNRNWPYKWREGGAEGKPSMDSYEGPAPLSAPESLALSQFISAHAVDGSERIRGAIDFHTFAELVLYPFGYTKTHTPEGMSSTQRERFRKVAIDMQTAMKVPGKADYKVMQSAYQVTVGSKSGVLIDWEWGQHKIFAFTIELPPKWEDEGQYEYWTDWGRTASHLFHRDYNLMAPELDRAFRAVLVLLRVIANREWPPYEG